MCVAAIIFDFDGTIADSFDYVANFLAVEAGVAPLSEEQKQSLRGLSIAGMVRQMGNGYIRSMWLFLKGRHWMGNSIHLVKPFSGMTEVIQKLHAEGHELFIVSSNNLETIRKFLHKNQLHTYFLEIYGGVGLFGKAPALRRILKEQNIEKQHAIYIGDEMRDVQAAKSLKLGVVAVTWGFARPESLRRLRPTAIADTPAELMSVLENI